MRYTKNPPHHIDEVEPDFNWSGAKWYQANHTADYIGSSSRGKHGGVNPCEKPYL